MNKILVTALSYFSDRPGGSERLSFDLAHGFAEKGYDVYILVSDVACTGIDVEKDGCLTVVRYQNKTIKAIGFLKPWLNISRAKRALRYFVPNDIEIIHGHDLFSYLGATNHFKKSNPRTIYTAHSPAISELKIAWKGRGRLGWLKCIFGLPLIKHFEKKCFKASNVITAESDFTVSELRSQYGEKIVAKCVVIPGWINTERFNPYRTKEEARQLLEWPLDKPIIFCLRRLAPRMGIENLLTAVSIASKKGFDLHLMIGGEGERRKVLEKKATDLRISDNVDFLGRVSEKDLPLAYAACDLSIVPTHSLEGFGIIVLESLASGRPVLATPVGALPELVGFFEPQWISYSNDADSIANLLFDFLEKKLPEHSPVELYTKVLERYSFPKALREYERILQSKQ